MVQLRSEPAIDRSSRPEHPVATSVDAVAVILGDELRRARRHRGWTRKQLQSRLRSDISLQTIATYELGTRRCSVTRLVELCQAMDLRAHEMLQRVYERTEHLDRPDRLVVELDRVAYDRQPELLPLRRWARQRLGQLRDNQPRVVSLEMAALARMAELCGLTTTDLIGRLRDLEDAELPGPPIAEALDVLA